MTRYSIESKGFRLGGSGQKLRVSPVESAADFQRFANPFIICRSERLSESKARRYDRRDVVLNEGSIAYGNKMSSTKTTNSGCGSLKRNGRAV